jgi:hypothetical protein
MPESKDLLWPFDKRLAVLLAVVLPVPLLILFALLDHYSGWPGQASRTPLLFAAFGLSLIPLVLVVLDFAASRRAVVDIKGVRIDFSHVEIGVVNTAGRSSALPDNIGIAGTIPTDDWLTLACTQTGSI